MKKYLKLNLVYIGMVIIILGLLKGCTSVEKAENLNLSSINKVSNQSTNVNYDEVKDSLIRFHVIANSDSDDDQNLKIKVKNEVISYLYPYLEDSNSVDESRKIIKENMDTVKKIAEDIIKNNNYNYSVKVQLSKENFPEKAYGNVVLPQGEYEAFRIIIGNGSGKNWWCVMFPPLCFVDETKAQIEYEKTKNKLKTNEKNKDEDEAGENIKIDFKIIEIIDKLFK